VLRNTPCCVRVWGGWIIIFATSLEGVLWRVLGCMHGNYPLTLPPTYRFLPPCIMVLGGALQEYFQLAFVLPVLWWWLSMCLHPRALAGGVEVRRRGFFGMGRKKGGNVFFKNSIFFCLVCHPTRLGTAWLPVLL